MSKVCGTPNAIEVLLHHHVSPSPHPREHAPAVKAAQDMLHAEGLLSMKDAAINVMDVTKKTERVYQTTALGAAHVRQMCDLSFPKLAYLDYNGRQIKP